MKTTNNKQKTGAKVKSIFNPSNANATMELFELSVNIFAGVTLINSGNFLQRYAGYFLLFAGAIRIGYKFFIANK